MIGCMPLYAYSERCPLPSPSPPSPLQAVQQNEGMPLPDGGVTVNSPHSADSYASLNEWSYEVDGYNVNDLGAVTMVNLKVRGWERCCQLS